MFRVKKQLSAFLGKIKTCCRTNFTLRKIDVTKVAPQDRLFLEFTPQTPNRTEQLLAVVEEIRSRVAEFGQRCGGKPTTFEDMKSPIVTLIVQLSKTEYIAFAWRKATMYTIANTKRLEIGMTRIEGKEDETDTTNDVCAIFGSVWMTPNDMQFPLVCHGNTKLPQTRYAQRYPNEIKLVLGIDVLYKNMMELAKSGDSYKGIGYHSVCLHIAEAVRFKKIFEFLENLTSDTDSVTLDKDEYLEEVIRKWKVKSVDWRSLNRKYFEIDPMKKKEIENSIEAKENETGLALLLMENKKERDFNRGELRLANRTNMAWDGRVNLKKAFHGVGLLLKGRKQCFAWP